VKAIIVAAGMGRRLRPYTDDRPKCLVEINGKSILARQLDAYRNAGIDDITIVRGYMKERLNETALPSVHFIDNDDFASNNILLSLFHAEAKMAGGFLMSYADIVFRPEVVRTALMTEGDYALVVDRRWAEAYEGRSLHPLEEAEVARVEGGRVTRVGKKTVPPEQATGEFIGLARISARGAEAMRTRFHQRRRELAGQPYGTAARFEVSYVTDLFNDLISDGAVMRPAFIDGGWREIDTVEDLERAAAVVSW
jgi:choline kinase